MVYNEDKNMQERFSLEDTLSSQRKLLNLIYDKIDNKPYFRTREERLDFMDLVSRSFLGSAIRDKINIVPVYNLPSCAIPLGRDIAHFALNIMMHIKSDIVKLKMIGVAKTYDIPAKELWKTFLSYCLVVFPRSQSEAYHSSVERQTRPQSTEGYDIMGDMK